MNRGLKHSKKLRHEVSQVKEASPKKSPIGLWTLVALVVANMIGTGPLFF